MSIKNPDKTSGGDKLWKLLESDPKYDKNGRRGWRIAGPIIIVCAIIAVLIAADFALNSGRIYWGVEVGTVQLGGKTPAEAREAVEERTTGALKEFDFTGPEEFKFTAGEMGVDFDVAASVDKAYQVGRQGSVLDRLKERAQGLLGTVYVEPVVDYQPEVARGKVENLAARLNQQPVEATVEIIGSEVQTSDSARGYKMNVPATVENVNGAVEDMTGDVKIVGKILKPEITTTEARKAAEKIRAATSGDVTFTAEGQQWTLTPADVGWTLDVTKNDGGLKVKVNTDRLKQALGNVYAALTIEPQEAVYDLSGPEISVIPSETGRRVEEKKLLNAVEEGIFEGKREYQVPLVTAQPELTTSEANRLKPTELLGSYRTNYSIVPDNGERTENLQIASGAVNGVMVAPGEIFSMNDTVAGYDYNSTKVIVNGRETKADGGGLCQVTSTLYMAANFAGLDVVERHPHYAQLPYIRPGLDATIWFGALDMKFENTTEGYLLLREYVSSDGYIYAEIYGKPNGAQVEMYSEPLYMGADYSKWITYQTVTKNGETVYDGELHTDTYEPLVDEKGKEIKPSEVYVPPVRQ